MWHYHRECLPPRPIDAFVECTSVTNIFPLRENTVQTTENTRLPVGTVPQQALSGLPMPLTITTKLSDPVVLSREGPWLPDLAGWMTSKPKASLRGGIGLWRENVSKRWQWRRRSVLSHSCARDRRHIDKDKALLWSPGHSSHFWNIQTPPNLKKTSAISQAGCDFIARPERNTHRPAHVANLGRLS
ncbi:hypothetical protein EV363DRAFT_1346108 [Boletus edulis]|nr:hypothetical protein EV363DRAFT_1346108 [Boletus edulis]